jgi:hypothetical protein
MIVVLHEAPIVVKELKLAALELGLERDSWDQAG